MRGAGGGAPTEVLAVTATSSPEDAGTLNAFHLETDHEGM